MQEPNIDGVNKILVVGAGAMGSQIGMVCSLAGYEVVVQDIDEDMLEEARKQLEKRMSRNVEKERNSQKEVDDAFGRMDFTTDLEGPATEADVAIEAAVEKLDVKREIFAQLDESAPEHAVLATNSSTIVSSQIADATSRPDRVCNMHFFNPALVMKCVEVVRGPETSDATVETVVELTQRIGKAPVVLEKEISGFVANRILGGFERRGDLSIRERCLFFRGHRHGVQNGPGPSDGAFRANGPHGNRRRLLRQDGPLRRERRPGRQTERERHREVRKGRPRAQDRQGLVRVRRAG